MNIPKHIEQFRKDMTLKNYCKNSIDNYCDQIALFLRHFAGKYTEPAKISAEDIKDYLLSAACVNSQRHRHSAIKLFYSLTIHQPFKFRYIEYARKERKLPFPLDQSEVAAILNVCKNVKHRAVICLLYGCGLRISEVLNLKPEHIDSRRMVINIIAAKGKKDRQVMLDEKLLHLLREYYKLYQPKKYLFNGQNEPQYSERSVNQFLKKYATQAGIRRNIHAHLLRHSFATHALEQGTDIRIIQSLLGHSSPKTTQIYAHVSTRLISQIKSPLSSII